MLKPLLSMLFCFSISTVGDADKIKAKYENGVLRLTLPKQKKRLPEGRRLEIE